MLASIVIERIYHKPYEQLIDEKIGEPLGMVDTAISLTPAQSERLMTGYDRERHVAQPSPEISLGAGALKSTTTDMLRYAQWEMTEADPAVQLSHKPTFSYGNYSIGLNWQIVRAGRLRRIWQEGDIPGFVSICAVVPELKIGIVVLANEEDSVSSHALTLMANQILKGLNPESAVLF